MSEQKKNGIPQMGPDTGNYWCTWDTQFRVNSVEDGKDTKNLRNVLTQDFLFAEDGMLRNYLKNVRQDLYVLLDDGWDVGKDVPGNGAVSVFGSLVLDSDKFPDFTGEPWERLTKLRCKLMELGYRGLGLWICANATGEEEAHPLSVEEAENYWKERAIWCRKAGVDYWKVDWGYHCGDAAYREMMTRIVKQYAPDLKIEHAVCRGPLDEKVEQWKRVGKLLSISDYVRTYDVVKEFTYSTTIARTWEMFDQDRKVQFGCRGIPNIEYAPLLAA